MLKNLLEVFAPLIVLLGVAIFVILIIAGIKLVYLILFQW